MWYVTVTDGRECSHYRFFVLALNTHYSSKNHIPVQTQQWCQKPILQVEASKGSTARQGLNAATFLSQHMPMHLKKLYANENIIIINTRIQIWPYMTWDKFNLYLFVDQRVSYKKWCTERKCLWEIKKNKVLQWTTGKHQMKK